MPQTRTIPVALGIVGALLIAVGAGFDAARGQAFTLGFNQYVLIVLGTFMVLECIASLRAGRFPALWGAFVEGGRFGTAAAFAIAALLTGLSLFLFSAYVADDSYITFRFSKHLAEGFGIAWNPGDPPVEGYSNFLWMIAAAAGLALRLDPVLVARVLGIVCLAGSLVAVRALAVELAGGRRYANLPVLLLGATPAFAYWTMSGLETISVVLLLLLYVRSFIREFRRDTWPWRTAALGVLLFLSRPETPLFILLSFVPLLRESAPHRWRWTLRWLAVFLPPVLAYVAWKWITFDKAFANTISAKFGFLRGLALSSQFFLLVFPLLLVVFLAPRATERRPLGERQILWMTAGMFLAALNIAPQVGHYYRFFLPVLGLLVAMIPLYTQRVRELEGAPRATPAPAGAAMIGLAMLYLASPLFEMAAYANAEAAGTERAHRPLARALARHFGPEDILAASDCGLVPYVSGMKTIDMWGLADRRVAEHGFDPAYVMETRPAVVVLHSLSSDSFRGRENYDRELHAVIASRGDYRLVGKWEFFGYWLWVYSTRPEVFAGGQDVPGSS